MGIARAVGAIFKKKKISDLRVAVSQDYIIRRSRILVVDDERPDVIDDLAKSGFSVDHRADIDRQDVSIVERAMYDLILLDYGNVGKAFGAEEGLALLKHIKRTNPAVVVLTYTSRALRSQESEFYTLSDGNLTKDAGITDSREKIEEGLRRAHSLPRLWNAFLLSVGVAAGSAKDADLQHQFVKAIYGRDAGGFKSAVGQLVGGGGQTLAEALVDKAFELALLGTLGV